MANLLTLARMALSLTLLCFPAFSAAFYILFVLAGLTDAFDGWVARKTGTASEFGSRLDTAADFVFVAACMIKLLPAVELSPYLLIWTAVIAGIKLVNLLSGFAVHRRFVVAHTALNRITGGLLFVLPMTIPFADLRFSGGIVCVAATLAAIQEGHAIRSGKGL